MPPCSPADTRLGTVARDQRSLGASVMFFQSEVTTARPELDRERARLLFVGVEMEVSLPLARRDQPVGDVAHRHDRAQRAVGDAVLEGRAHALLGHLIGAFDDCERRMHFPNAAYQRVNVNLAACRRDVFGDDAVRKQEGKAAGDAGVDAQDWRGAAIGERVEPELSWIVAIASAIWFDYL